MKKDLPFKKIKTSHIKKSVSTSLKQFTSTYILSSVYCAANARQQSSNNVIMSTSSFFRNFVTNGMKFQTSPQKLESNC